MKKKNLIVSILLVLIILIIGYWFAIHIEIGLNKETKMSNSEIVALLNKGKDYSNYYMCPQEINILGKAKSDNILEKDYTKDNVVKEVKENEIRWYDYNTMEHITLTEMKGKKVAFIQTITENELEEYKKYKNDTIISNADYFNCDFKYMGEKEENGRKIIVVKVWNKNTIWKANGEQRFFIDKASGLVTKITNYYNLGFAKNTTDMNLKLDCVTDNDIKKPSIEGYEVMHDGIFDE